MGKNQTYKAMQRARIGSSSAAPEEIEDGMMDGSFHSPAWHAARLASLNTSHTITWEEFKKKRKEDELKESQKDADKDRIMREYRAQLDAEREKKKLSKGRNHLGVKSHRKKEKRDKSSKRSSSKRKHKRRSSSSESSLSSGASSSDDERVARRSKSRSKKMKEKKHRRRSGGGSSENEGSGGGPVPLSRFFQGVKS